jgi:hypothetical protein
MSVNELLAESGGAMRCSEEIEALFNSGRVLVSGAELEVM